MRLATTADWIRPLAAKKLGVPMSKIRYNTRLSKFDADNPSSLREFIKEAGKLFSVDIPPSDFDKIIAGTFAEFGSYIAVNSPMVRTQ